MSNRTSALSALLALVSAASPAVAAPTCPPPLTLSGWTLFDPDNNWVGSHPTPTSARLDEQDASASVHPGWFVSDFNVAATAVIEFDLSVQAGSSDDDLIGLGFSFLDGAHSYLLDWKKNTQAFNWGQPVAVNDDTAEQGLKIKRIDGAYSWDGLWGGSDGQGVSTIAGPAGGGWVAGTVYHFVLSLSPGQIVVTRDGAPLFDVTDASYPGGQGAIALYGFSQDNIILSNVCVTPTPTACQGDLDGNSSVDASDLAILLGAWGSAGADLTGDGTTDAQDLAVLLGAWGAC
jgi:Thrombospondin C-terminal region